MARGRARDRAVSPRRQRGRAACASWWALLLTAGCSHLRPHHPIAAASPPPPARPSLSPALATVRLPERAPDLGWMTINRGIGPEQTIWQFRAALNVGALVCRGPADAGLVADYNRILKADRATLRTADRAVKRLYRARYGAAWAMAHDVYMTRLYNFWAQPEGKPGFCAAAVALAADAAPLPDARFAAFAKAHLGDLERPFLQVFDRIAATQARMEEWDASHDEGGSGPPTAAEGATAGSR